MAANEKVDVVVVGAGASGSVYAIEAQKAGLSPPPPTLAEVEYAKQPSLQEVYDTARARFDKLYGNTT